MEISAKKSKTLVVGKTPETLRTSVKFSGKQSKLNNSSTGVAVCLIQVDRRMK